MGIPPDPLPFGQKGTLYCGQTSFDVQTGGKHIRYAEIRSSELMDVTSVQFSVIPPEGGDTMPIVSVWLGEAHIGQRQFTVAIQSKDASPISDGYMCQFTFHIVS